MTVSVTSTQTSVPCPVCAVPTARLHSRYTRTLADLPWAAYRVHWQLRARKWFCVNPACERRIFTERIPTVAAPWARRTLRLVQRLVALGLILGGRAGVRLSYAWDPVEWHINRLKMLKRHMYGRAHLDLRSRRFVLAPQQRQAQGPSQPIPAQAQHGAAAA